MTSMSNVKITSAIIIYEIDFCVNNETKI